MTTQARAGAEVHEAVWVGWTHRLRRAGIIIRTVMEDVDD